MLELKKITSLLVNIALKKMMMRAKTKGPMQKAYLKDEMYLTR